MSDERTRVLQATAEDLGFKARWSTADLPAHVGERYRQWLEEGRQASMGELLRGLEVRLEPARRFGWVRSALVLAAPHAYPDPGPPDGGFRVGRVGRMFWVREEGYIERLVRPKLDELKAACRELGARCRDWVDQGPLPFRSYAAHSGLGWVGRNGMVIAPGIGTYMTLAVLLTDLQVDPEEPHKNRCGTCQRCLPACPTGALLGDGTLDSRRCISYWTTQHPGLIPPEVWPDIRNWLFGCDICQEACPWNAKAEGFWGGYQPENDLAHPDMRTFLSAYFGGRQFDRLYRGSAFARAGRTRLARNAVIVAANSDDSRRQSYCRLAAGDIDPVVRATAARALAQIGDAREASGLLKDPEPVVRQEAEAALDRASQSTHAPNGEHCVTGDRRSVSSA